MRKYRGFTLIELLVVIAIIGILAALVITKLGLAKQRAQNSSAQSDINEVGKSVEIFKNNDVNSGNVVINAVAVGAGNTDSISGDPGATQNNFRDIFTGVLTVATGGATNRYGTRITHTPIAGIYTYTYDTANTVAGTLGRVDAIGNTGAYVVGTTLNTVTGSQPAYWVQNGTSNSGVSVPAVP